MLPRNRKFFPGLAMMLVVSGTLLRDQQSIQVWRTWQQDLETTAAFLGTQDRLELQSGFCQMRTRADWDQLHKKLHAIGDARRLRMSPITGKAQLSEARGPLEGLRKSGLQPCTARERRNGRPAESLGQTRRLAAYLVGAALRRPREAGAPA